MTRVEYALRFQRIEQGHFLIMFEFDFHSAAKVPCPSHTVRFVAMPLLPKLHMRFGTPERPGSIQQKMKQNTKNS
jgi:hypothetical protein